MISLTHQFLAWCRSKPADEEYDFNEPDACAFYQFAVANDIPEPSRFYSAGLEPSLPAELREPLATEPYTFGALADRVERQLAEHGGMSSGFTPWGVEWTHGTAWIGPMRLDGSKVTSIVASIDFDENYRPEVLAQRRAYAHLIAAAPDLYEALKVCTTKLRKCSELAGNADWAIDAMCEQFEAALAKARGEQS